MLRFLPLPDLESAQLVCKQWRGGVLSEMRARVKKGLLFGKGSLHFEVSSEWREDVAEGNRHPLAAGAFPFRNRFKQNTTLTRQGCLVFEDQSRRPISLYLSVDVVAAHLVFPDVVGNHSSRNDAYNFHCIYLSDNRPVSEDILRQRYPRFGHLQLHEVAVIRTEVATKAFCISELEQTKRILLPAVEELDFDMPSWNPPSNAWRKGWPWVCSGVQLVPRIPELWPTLNGEDAEMTHKIFWQSLVDGSMEQRLRDFHAQYAQSLRNRD